MAELYRERPDMACVGCGSEVAPLNDREQCPYCWETLLGNTLSITPSVIANALNLLERRLKESCAADALNAAEKAIDKAQEGK